MPNYYNSYKGSRRRKRQRIRIVILIVLLLVIAGVAAFLLLQDKAVFSADGIRLPFGKKQSVSDDPLPDDIELVIEPPVDTPPATPAEDDPAVTPAPQEPDVTVPAVTPLNALYAGGFRFVQETPAVLTELVDSGRNELAILVKDTDGNTLIPDSDGAQGGVSPQAGAFAQALQELKSPPAILLPALKDNIRPRTMYRGSALHTSSGAVWLDRTYISWFDPTGKDTADNLLTQIRACEALGVKQVILTDFQFPTAGKTHLIDYKNIPSKTAALTELARQLSEGAEVELGLLLTDEAAQNLLDTEAGQDVMELAQYFDVLYLQTASGADPAVLEEAIRETGCRVGLYASTKNRIPDGFLSDVILISDN